MLPLHYGYKLVEMTGIEPVVTEVGRFTVSCHTITAASPLKHLAGSERFELPTTGFEDQDSIQLS